MVDSVRPFGRLHGIENYAKWLHLLLGLIFVWVSNKTIDFEEKILEDLLVLILSVTGFWLLTSGIVRAASFYNLQHQKEMEKRKPEHMYMPPMSRTATLLRSGVSASGFALLCLSAVMSVILAREVFRVSTLSLHAAACAVAGYVFIFLLTHALSFNSFDSLSRVALSSFVGSIVIFAAFYGSGNIRSFWWLIALVFADNVLSMFDSRNYYYTVK